MISQRRIPQKRNRPRPLRNWLWRKLRRSKNQMKSCARSAIHHTYLGSAVPIFLRGAAREVDRGKLQDRDKRSEPSPQSCTTTQETWWALTGGDCTILGLPHLPELGGLHHHPQLMRGTGTDTWQKSVRDVPPLQATNLGRRDASCATCLATW